MPPDVLRVAERGVRNVMIQQGLIAGEIERPSYPVTLVAATEPGDYIGSPADGIYESFYPLG